MAVFEFPVQVDMGFYVDEDESGVTPVLSKIYQAGEEFPAIALPNIGDNVEIVDLFSPTVTTRTLGINRAHLTLRAGPYKRPRDESGHDMQRTLIDALKIAGYR